MDLQLRCRLPWWLVAACYRMMDLPRKRSAERRGWNGLDRCKDKDDDTRNILQMTVDGKRNRGRPKLRWRDLVKEDMTRNQMTTEMAEDRKHWHVMIRAGTLRSVEADMWEGEKRTADHTLDMGGAEKGQHNKQGSVEEENNQLHQRPQMTGKSRKTIP